MTTATFPAPPAEPADTGPALFAEGEGRRYVRSPADVLRVLSFLAATALLFGLTLGADDAIATFELDVVLFFDFLTPSVERILSGITQLLVVVTGLLVLGTVLWTRRLRVLGYLALSNLATALAVGGLTAVIDRSNPDEVVNMLAERAGITTEAVPDVAGLGQLVAAFVVLGPFVTARWRRAGIVLIVLVTFLELLVAVHLPAELFLGLSVGALMGAAVLAVLGRPSAQPTLPEIASALGRVGLTVTALRPAAVDARGSTPYFATLGDGSRLFVKVLGSDERAADLLFRAYRALRFKNLGDERPFSSLRRTVEHEALVSLQARDVGIRTPRMRAVVDVGTDGMLLAYELVEGRSLDGLEDADVGDELICRIWEQVALLRHHRIAHRDLRRANVFVDDTGEPWLIDFGFSEVAAGDRLLASDVAQLLVSLAVPAGARRSVELAVEVLGPEAVGACLPRLQFQALSGATQAAVKDRPGLLEEIQERVTAVAGVEAPEFEPLQRISRNTVLTIVMLVLVTYFLLPQLADLPGIVRQIGDANWAWAPLILLVSAATYGFAGLSMAGSVPDRLRIGPTIVAQVAASFAGKLAPSVVGGMALNVRFLQLQGVDGAVAATGVGLNSVGGLAMHVVLLLLFVVWAGRSAFGSFELPDPHLLLWGVGAVALLAAIAFAVPAVRRLVLHSVVPVLARSAGGVVGVMRRPVRLAMLLGGSAGLTMSYIVAVYLSLQAFGGGLAFAQVGAIYLGASALAVAAPTPGGLGALEAALIAGFTAAGLDSTVAVPTVFLYRLATFWLPILPGWIGFGWLRRQQYL